MKRTRTRTRSSSNGASPLSGPSSDQDFHSCGSNSSTEEEAIQPTSRKRRHITSNHEPVVTILTIEDLDEVLEMINKHNFDVTKYEEIGLSLGLFKTTIDAIKEEYRGNPQKCFMQILAKWLSRVDKVNKKGIPTWFTLIKKIRLIDIAAAGRIDDDVHPACRILKSVSQNHSVWKALPLFSMLLFHEDIIDEVPVDVQVIPEGATSLLQKVEKSVCHNHENLKKFASILKKYKCTAKGGCTLMKKYIKEFGGDDIMAQERKDLVSIDISQSSCSEFSDIRIHLGSTFRAVDKAICSIKPPLDCRDVKKFIRFIRSDLKVEVDDVLFFIREHCSLLNIELLEALVKEFNIEGAKKAIQDYKAYLKIFSDRVKGKFCLEQKIALCSSLKCETITVTVDKDIEQICFEDIGILMKSAFETLSSSIHVHVIRRDNSFTIICSFSLTLSVSLISTALKNLKVLKEKGIIKLTIGYCTVYDYKEDMFYTEEGKAKGSSDAELQDYITSVYTSRETLEQLLVSTSVQLMNSEEETISLNEEILKRKMKEESMKKSLEGKSKMLSAARSENENFKQIADETRKLVQEKTEHETENEALKEKIHSLEEQLALFQSEKEEPKDDDIRIPKAKDQELKELKIGTPNLFESRQLSLSSESRPSPSLDDSYKRSVSYTPSDQQKAPPCEKDTTNKAWQVLDVHHDELVDIIRSDDRLCTEMMEQLYECFLIGSAEKEVIEQLPSLDIRSKAIMERVSTFISKARNPIGAFAKFFFVLKNFANFREINDNLRKEVHYAGFQLRDSSQSTRKTLPPKKLMESSNPDAVTELDDDLVTESIKKYSHHLKRLYKKQKPDPKWSMESAPSTVYVDLAVLKKDEVCSDPFTKSTIHGIDDDIFQRKDPLSLEDLCSIDYGDAILIEGAPGIGKSMLAFEICKRWVQGSALQKYALLLLLRLRDKFIQKCQTVRELLGSLLGEPSWKATAIQDIIDNSGEGLIVIFEGFDELPEELTESDSLFFQFARELSGASLVFTSRPSAKHCLKQELTFERHVEVIGFTPASIKKYVTEFFKGDSEHIKSFYQHLEESPRIGDCLYVPVNLVIICSIFMQCIRNDEQVPLKGIVTSTKLYHIMIRTLLYRHMKSQDPDKKISTLEDLKKLPDSVKEDFLKVCKIAYEGLRGKKTKLLFYANDDIGSDFETLGIMQKETQLYPGAGDVIVYYFLHFTIQEFLAAYHVSQLSQREIKDHFHRFKNVRNLSTMLCFLAGLTELKSIKLSVSRELHNMNVIHYLYESGDETIMKKVFGNSEDHFKVSRLLPKATPYDMYKLGRCIAFSKCHWELSFTLRGVTPDHIEKLQKGLASVKSISCLIKGLSFSLNPIGDEGMIELLCFPEYILAHLGSLRLMSCELQPQSATELARHFHKFRNLGTFFYHNNRFKEGNQLQLLEAMMPLQCKHVSFSKLSPEECSLLLTRIPSVNIVELYQLGSSSIEALIECLHNSVSLEVMHIEQSQCTIENISQLPKTLPSSILQKLKLINCGIDSDSICIIIEAVLKSLRLETLDLRDNFIDDKGASHLSTMLKQLLEDITTTDVCNKLKYLCIGHNPFTEIGLLSLLKELCNYSKHEKDIDFTLSLCLHWKDYATRQGSYLDAEKHLKFNCNED